MNFSQLDALLAIAKYGSINKAAEALYISQPALKKRLDTLESELNTPLFVRNPQGCILTPAGRILCEQLPPLYHQMQDVIRQAQTSTLPLKLRISQVPMLTLRYCDMLIADFQRRHANVSIERVFMNNDVWMDAMHTGRIDLCLVPGTDAAAEAWEKEGFVPVHDGDSGLVAILAPNHPLARRTELSLSDLRPYPVYSEPLMLEYGGLAAEASAAGLSIQVHENAFNRYSMTDSSSQGCIYLHCTAIGQDVASLVSIPIRDFSFHCFILLRTLQEPAIGIFHDYLSSRSKKREVLRYEQTNVISFTE